MKLGTRGSTGHDPLLHETYPSYADESVVESLLVDSGVIRHCATIVLKGLFQYKSPRFDWFLDLEKAHGLDSYERSQGKRNSLYSSNIQMAT